MVPPFCIVTGVRLVRKLEPRTGDPVSETADRVLIAVPLKLEL